MSNNTTKVTSSINSQPTQKAQDKAVAPSAAALPQKKRSRLSDRSMLTLPEGLDRERFKYRWISRARVESRTDGWDSRGWEIHKDPETQKPFTCGDLILGKMPTEDVEARRVELEEISLGRMQATLEQQKADDERLSHEVRKAGGKIKATISYGED